MNQAARTPSLSWLEKTVAIHVSVLLIGSAWAFGGNIWWARLGLSIWASLSLPLAIAAFFGKDHRRREARRNAWWLLPAILYGLLVIVSTLNPTFEVMQSEVGPLLVHKGGERPHWPGTVDPAASLTSLWFGAGAYLSAFNLVLILRSRSVLRTIMVITATNVLVLSVFGTLQQLANAGFYFGAATSPNKRFFATFIYNNHWGAFMIMGLAVATGLLFYFTRKLHGRDLWHSPLSAALLGVFLIAATAPISASRAATGLSAILLLIAIAKALSGIAASRRRRNRPVWPAITLIILLISGGVCSIGWLGFRSMNQRYIETRLALERNQSLWGERAELYHDTWELARREPLFGWGLASYDVAFQLIRPRPLQPSRQYESSYATAHNDWLQSLAETGFMGTGLLLFALAIPLARLQRRQLSHPLVAYPLIGLALVLLYAGMEFPFSNAAVLILFWTCLFGTVQYARLQDLTKHRHEEHPA